MKQTWSDKRRARREKLMRDQNGLCHWCNEPMEMPERGQHHITGPNEATLEHLDNRLSAARGERLGKRRVVLAHSKCNQITGWAISGGAHAVAQPLSLEQEAAHMIAEAARARTKGDKVAMTVLRRAAEERRALIKSGGAK
jgi:hypothetical protein